MAERVVDDLEAIEVEEQDGQTGVVALRVRQRDGQTVLEQQAVRQVRQRVVIGEVFDLLLGVRALGDVAHYADHAVALDRRQRNFLRERAVFAAQSRGLAAPAPALRHDRDDRRDQPHLLRRLVQIA